MDGLRQSGNLDDLPRGLLARAGLRRFMENSAAAAADLGEAFDIADRGGMRLHLTDAHLERARLWVTQGRTDAAREDLEQARELVDDTGYHRRDLEVSELERVLGG